MLPCSQLSNNKDLDVLEVASAVEEELEAVCCLQLYHGQNATMTDGSDAACRCIPDFLTTEELDVKSMVEEESEAVCHRRRHIQNTTTMDKS